MAELICKECGHHGVTHNHIHGCLAYGCVCNCWPVQHKEEKNMAAEEVCTACWDLSSNHTEYGVCTVSDCTCRGLQTAEQTASGVRAGTVGEVIDRRVQVYGNPIETFVDIAKVWSGITGHDIQPAVVPLMMVGMKAVRARVMPEYSDNSDDIDGYMDIFRQIVGEDMIHARTVNDFIAQRWPDQS